MNETRVNIGKAHADYVKKKFIEAITDSLNEISKTILAQFNNDLKSIKTKLKISEFEEEFKEDFLKKWLTEFSSLWNDNDLTSRMAQIKIRKADAAAKGLTTGWRQTGKMPYEQVQDVRMLAMNDYVAELERMLTKQTGELEAKLIEIEEKRSYLNEMSKRRQKITEQIDIRIGDFQNQMNQMFEANHNTI